MYLGFSRVQLPQVCIEHAPADGVFSPINSIHVLFVVLLFTTCWLPQQLGIFILKGGNVGDPSGDPSGGVQAELGGVSRAHLV
jgi:hypothetical protein